MKKNRLYIALSIVLLAFVLTGRVGIHLFHHHESSLQTKSNPLTVSFSVQNSEVDCLLCKLDTFQEIFLVLITPFVFINLFVKSIFRFLFPDLLNFSFLKQNKGPPVTLTV